ncbi:hypothetical protein MCP1_10223 [Candidatus Terasakiella magnetica]|nr:hypothetical protein MCP1_10223 [Candidatus Terasakiella magnetica]
MGPDVCPRPEQDRPERDLGHDWYHCHCRRQRHEYEAAGTGVGDRRIQDRSVLRRRRLDRAGFRQRCRSHPHGYPVAEIFRHRPAEAAARRQAYRYHPGGGGDRLRRPRFGGRILEEGFNQVITKPISIRKLLDEVARYCRAEAG